MPDTQIQTVLRNSPLLRPVHELHHENQSRCRVNFLGGATEGFMTLTGQHFDEHEFEDDMAEDAVPSFVGMFSDSPPLIMCS